MSQSKLVFITGGTGYLGRHVIPALIARGHRVRALTVSQMVHALVDAIEHPPDDARIVGVPEMKTRF